ncbi:MAG: SprB repeat-containing protein, partial [Lewinella sp.]|nr:SprB repeat-containing protein [Lewinella sp.]
MNTTQSGTTGSWSGPGVSGNTFNPATANTGSNGLTFTPDPGQCAGTNNLNVLVNAVPTANPTTFNICVLSIAPPAADYDLPGTENVINGGTGLQVNWYNDAAGTSPINDINDVAGLPSTVFATVFNGQCESSTVPVTVQLEFAPASQNASAQACDSGNGTAVFDLTTLAGQVNGTPGITVTFYLDNTGLNPVPNPGNFTATNGTVLYAFASSPSGCRSAQPGTVTLNVVSGIDPAAVGLDVSPTALCGPGDVTLTFTLPIGGSYTVAYSYSNSVIGTINSTITTTNGGSTLIFVDATTDFYITQVSTGSCSTPITPTPVTVAVQVAPDIFPINDVTACGSYTLPAIQGTNLTGQEAYHTGPNGTGITYFPGEVITSSVILYALDFASPLCLDEEIFLVDIAQAPDLIVNNSTEICPGGSLDLSDVVLDLNFTGLPITFHSANPPTPGNQLTNTTVSPGSNTTYYAFANGGAGCQDVLPIPVTVLAAPVAANPGNQAMCDTGTGFAVFNLSALNPVVANGQSVTVSWYSNAGATVAISNPDAYSTAGGLVYAAVSNGQCTSLPVAVSLVVNPNPVATVANTVDPDCTVGNNGAISIAVNGGSSPYIFDWDPDALDGEQNPTGLEPGDYTVTVTDQNGCSDMTAATLSAASGIELACGETQQASSPGASDGEAIVIVTGGVPPFQLSWSGPVSGSQTLANNDPFFITGLPVGEYSIVLTDSQGCETTCEFSMSSFGCNILLDIAGTDPTCPGGNNGSISLDVQNASGAVSFDWDVDSLDGTEDPAGLQAGTYNLTVTDETGCEATASVTLNDPPALVVNCGQNSPASGINTADGSALIGFGGGTPPYAFNFTGPTPISTTASTASAGTVFPGLLPGDYVLTFTDANGCSTTCNFTINGPGCFVQVTADPTDPTCAGANDGSIELTVINSSGNLTFDWNVNALDGQQNPTGLAPGAYSVTVTDANNCTAETTINLTDPPALLLSCAQQSAVSMVGAADGVAAITPGGGTPPYTLAWSGPGSGTQNAANAGTVNITGLAAGVYSVTMTDANGCTSNCGFTINTPNCDLTIDIAGTDVTCPGAENGSIDLTINGGFGPFAIDWNADGLDATEDPTDLAPGTYAVTVTDTHACTATASVNIGTAATNPGIAISA